MHMSVSGSMWLCGQGKQTVDSDEVLLPITFAVCGTVRSMSGGTGCMISYRFGVAELDAATFNRPRCGEVRADKMRQR